MQKTVFQFTVGELVGILKSMPQDLPLLVNGYNSGYENVYYPEIRNLTHDVESMEFDGEFQIADENNTGSFEAVILERVVRSD